MQYIFLFIIAFILNGCSPKSLENTVENLFVASSGNKPPSFFKIANVETMRDYVFDMPDYTIALPSAKEKDFTLMNGWEGATSYNKNMGIYLDNYGILYHIYVSTSIYKYEERERAAEYKDGSETNINVHYETHGKENYPCIVTSSKDNEYAKKGIGYSCFKFNKTKTLVKDVVISLTYSKSPYSDSPNFPKETLDLIKDYTYEDLQERAKRMLDSLYIKDGWDE
ncbi:hypothetical protein ACN9J6_03845 [Aliarcobacter butzleri]|uniref:hypothetical protein n=1 Tax=Aliarcobacter butzleri TaxID=28197 RepID=UPI003B20DB7C